MDENSVWFQMFLIQLSFITLGSESQICLFMQCQSNIWLFFGGGGGGSIQFFASFISFCLEKLSYLACGEKIIRVASSKIAKT